MDIQAPLPADGTAGGDGVRNQSSKMGKKERKKTPLAPLRRQGSFNAAKFSQSMCMTFRHRSSAVTFTLW